jgi:hypothetical protein
MLRSVLAAALSAVVVFGVGSGLVGKASDVRAVSSSAAVAGGGEHAEDTSWD